MIKVANIKGSPERTPDKYIGIHSDDSYFYFFEDEREMKAFYDSLPVNNNAIRAEIEQRAENLYDSLLEKYWYTRFDVVIYAEQGEKPAQDLIVYYKTLWNVIETNFAADNYTFDFPIFEL